MHCQEKQKRLPHIAFLLGFLALSCTGTRSSVKTPFGKGNMNASSIPCPPKPSGLQLDDTALSLTSNPAATNEGEQTIRMTKMVKIGGYVDISFMGIGTSLRSFTDAGNTTGIVDVLDIPYCTDAASISTGSELWISRCLSRRTQALLEKDSSLRDEFIRKWRKPELTTKRCTAQFSVDPDDTETMSSMRIRVWTAEHCFQPAYSRDVTLQVYLPPEAANPLFKLNRGVYIPVALKETDAASWRKKVLAIGGGGGKATDPKLAEKILILRSTDGRSSQMYVDTMEKYCIDYSGEDFPQFGGQSAKYVDCFAMTDMGTFKGTISDHQPRPKKKRIVEETLSGAIAEARKAAIGFIRSESIKAKSHPTDIDFVNSITQSFSQVPNLNKYFSINKFMISIVDGLQHARRVQAYDYELRNAVSKRIFTSASIEAMHPKLAPFQKYFSLAVYNSASDVNASEEITTLLQQAACPLLEENLGSISKGSLNDLSNTVTGRKCARREFQPPDTIALEELALKDSQNSNILDSMMKRLNVLFFHYFNNKITKVDRNHPLSIKLNDSVFTANLKLLSFQIKLWLDVILMHRDPGAGVPLIANAAKAFQQALVSSCRLFPSTKNLGGYLFPILGNAEQQNGFLSFSRLLPISRGRSLNIIPIGMSDRSMYSGSLCENQYGLSDEFRHMANTPQGPMPAETIYGVRVDDALISSGPDSDLQKYVSSRVFFKFEGAQGNPFLSAGPGDSGAMFTFLGLPAFVYSTHNGYSINGIVLAELPDLNEPVAQPETGSIGSGGTCN